METDVEIRTQEKLIFINDILLKIKKELEIIKELVKEDGHLRTIIDTTNQKLIKDIQERGVKVEDIINKSKHDRLEANLSSVVTSTIIAEQLEQMKD